MCVRRWMIHHIGSRYKTVLSFIAIAVRYHSALVNHQSGRVAGADDEVLSSFAAAHSVVADVEVPGRGSGVRGRVADVEVPAVADVEVPSRVPGRVTVVVWRRCFQVALRAD